MKLILEKVKIYGFDPEMRKNDFGQFSVPIYISKEQRDLIDSYIYGKCETTKDGENLFKARSRAKIKMFDATGAPITNVVNKEFIADVSLLIDEFQERDENKELVFNDDGTPSMIRYSKCLGLKYVSDVEGGKEIYIAPHYDTFDEIFGGENETAKAPDFSAMKSPEEIGAQNAVTASSPETFEPTQPEFNDLPWDLNGKDPNLINDPF